MLYAFLTDVSNIEMSSTIAWCLSMWKTLFASSSDLCLLFKVQLRKSAILKSINHCALLGYFPRINNLII